jgi:hypothetical protein
VGKSRVYSVMTAPPWPSPGAPPPLARPQPATGCPRVARRRTMATASGATTFASSMSKAFGSGSQKRSVFDQAQASGSRLWRPPLPRSRSCSSCQALPTPRGADLLEVELAELGDQPVRHAVDVALADEFALPGLQGPAYASRSVVMISRTFARSWSRSASVRKTTGHGLRSRPQYAGYAATVASTRIAASGLRGAVRLRRRVTRRRTPRRLSAQPNLATAQLLGSTTANEGSEPQRLNGGSRVLRLPECDDLAGH